MSLNEGYEEKEEGGLAAPAPTLQIRMSPEPQQDVPHSVVRPTPINAVNRDPNNINGDVKVTFSDVFAEQGDVDSFEGVWSTSETVFTETKFVCYRILSTVCGIPCAFFWGIQFSCLAFCCVWNGTPMLRHFRILLGRCSVAWRLCVQCYLDPCYESCGKMFSNIKTSLVYNKSS